MKWVRKGIMMLRFILYVVFFFLLFRLIRRLFSSASASDSESSPLRKNPPKEEYHDHMNEAEIEDATFEEIEKDPSHTE